jgi:cobalt-zinc-cadmium efflux system membrane fusion protein
MANSVHTTPILIVDDDEVLGQVLTRVLTQEGRTIFHAATVAQATELAAQQKPALALLDLRLPDGDGIDLARTLQAAHPELRLILMTAYPLRLREKPELAERFLRVLTKPLNLQELRQAVDAALTDSGALAPAVSAQRPPVPVPAAHSEPVPTAPPPPPVVISPAVSTPTAPPNYRKWAAYAAVAAAIAAIVLFVPPMFGVPGVQALWTEPAPKEMVEQTTPLAVELVKGQAHTLSVPADVLVSLGIRKGKIENTAPAERPDWMRPLVMPGSTAHDDTRLARVRIRFNAEVTKIPEVRPHPDQPETDENRPREIEVGDKIEKGQPLAVLQSVEVANMKSTLVNAWVQLYFDQGILNRFDAARSVIPDLTFLTAERNVRQDQTTIASAYTTLLTWGLTKEDLQKLRGEADELTQLRLKSLKDKESKNEEEALWAVKKEAWSRVEVRAPRSGTLVERNVSLGEFVADNTQPLFQIADVQRMVVLANPAEIDLPALLKLKKEKGQLFWTVRTVGLPPEGRLYPINEISYFIDQNQHTAVVKGYIDNPDGMLRVGQFASASLELPAPLHVAQIPMNALAEDGKQSVVFVVKDHDRDHFVVEMRRVIVTHRFDKTAFVLSDFDDLAPEKQHRTKEEADEGLLDPNPLEHGARIITSGILELKAALEEKESAAEGK